MPHERRRLRDLPVRAKLALIVGLPTLAALVGVASLVAGHHIRDVADRRSDAWLEHSLAVKDVAASTAWYVDEIGDRVAAAGSRWSPWAGNVDAAERELQRARAASLELATNFSTEEQREDALLAERLGELIERGSQVGTSVERYDALRRFYDAEVRDRIAERLRDEREGSRQAVAAARAVSRRVRLVGVMAGAIAVTVALALSVSIARQFDRSIAFLGRRARRVATGDLDDHLALDSRDELGQLAADFGDMVLALRRQRDDQLGFLAAVAHDLRNPLAALRTATEGLQRAPDLPADPRLRRTLALLDRQVGRLHRLAEDLLDAAKLEAGDFELRLERADVGALAREVCELYAGVSAAHSIRIAAPAAPVFARCDPARIVQVLNNLVSNAIRYSPHGGRVEIGVERQGDDVVLSVVDHGVGIDAKALPRIFEPFRRISPSREVLPGVGLGLPIVRRIVLAHGGSIEVDSTPGIGSTFRVRLTGAASSAPDEARASAVLGYSPAAGKA